MRTEAEWEQRRIQAKREFRQQLEALIPDLHGLIQELRTMPSAMPPPSGYEAEAKRFTIPGYVPGYFREFFEGEEQIHFNEWSFFSGAIRAVYNEVPSQPVYMKKTAPEVYNRYGYDEYRIDYQPGAPRRQQYKFLWRTAGQKQKWIQFELNRFLSWAAPRHLADYPDVCVISNYITLTLIDHLSSSRKWELRRQILRLAQWYAIQEWHKEYIDTKRMIADIQQIADETIIRIKQVSHRY